MQPLSQNAANPHLTPEMLVFDFQILHPLTLTTIFQLSSQNATNNHFIDKAT